MKEICNIRTRPYEDLQDVKGVAFPASMKFRQLLVTGPPGCGKTRLINQIGGWPEEGYIDLTLPNWWRAQSLSYRPREVHLGIPFRGESEALTVFDDAWLAGRKNLEIDFSRILLPPPKTYILGTNWRKRFMFEFLLPPAERVLEWRRERTKRSVHIVDVNIDLEQVQGQCGVYWKLAKHFHKAGILIYIREGVDKLPHYFVGNEQNAEALEKV